MVELIYVLAAPKSLKIKTPYTQISIKSILFQCLKLVPYEYAHMPALHS